MCTSFTIAKQTIDNFINNGVPFTYEQLTKQISSEGGVMRVAPGFTIKDYLHRLENSGKITYDFSTQQYYACQVAEN